MAEERSGFVSIGRVSKTHGLSGEVVVHADGDLSVLPSGLTWWFVPPPERVRSSTLTALRPGPAGPIVTLEGVHDRDTAAELVGCLVLVREEALPEGWFPEQERALVGYEVVDDVRGPLGQIEDVIITGANDVWVVEGPFGQVLVPVIDDVVRSVDHDGREARVRLLPGLIEED